MGGELEGPQHRLGEHGWLDAYAAPTVTPGGGSASAVSAALGCALLAIFYGLMAPEKWNARFNPQCEGDAAPGRTNWFTIFAVAASLMVGTAVLMASIAFSFQRYFEYQIEEARKISQ